MPCWTSYPLNLELIVQSSERCDFRHDSLAGAATACEARKSCGGITRDEGLRCGPSGLKMPYEIRSGRTLQGVRPPASWLFHRHGHHTAECTKQPLDMRPNESPRELWRKQHMTKHIRLADHTPLLNMSSMLRCTLLISGTLRGFRQCAHTIVDSLAKPNMPGANLVVSTYNKNDCGGSSGHGLGMNAKDVHIGEAESAFAWKGLPVVVWNESTTRINSFFTEHRQRPYSIFAPAVDRAALVRYTSQFYLRHRAWEMSSASRSDLVVLTRPDACIYGKWRARQTMDDLLTVMLHITLRDGTSCQVRLRHNDIVLPYSDIHRGEWDDTFAVGLRSSMKKYVELYTKLTQRTYAGSFPHPEALLKYHLQKEGVNVIDACGAARGDILELVKQCAV